jgi:hypothetical protein
MLIVYLDSGERREIPKAVTAAIQGDKLVCLSEEKRPIARFQASHVYFCSNRAVPSIPD